MKLLDGAEAMGMAQSFVALQTLVGLLSQVDSADMSLEVTIFTKSLITILADNHPD